MDNGYRKAGLDERGDIPARTECPFRSTCFFAAPNVNHCEHKGKDHTSSFDCSHAKLTVKLNTTKPKGIRVSRIDMAGHGCIVGETDV